MHLVCYVCSLSIQIGTSAGDFMTQTTGRTSSSTKTIDDALAPWQNAIYQGNLAFESGELIAARDHYTIASSCAETLLAQFSNIPVNNTVLRSLEHCIAAFVVATLNLADTFKVMQKPDKACTWLCHAHQRLSVLLSHPDQQVRTLVLHHHHKTYFELVKFAKMSSAFPILINRINQLLAEHPHKTQLLH